MTAEEKRVVTSDIGAIRIADDVVAVIAGLAATEVGMKTA